MEGVKMEGEKTANQVSSELAEMSLSDFLQEGVSAHTFDSDYHFHRQPSVQMGYPRDRRRGHPRGRGRGGRGYNTSLGSRSRREGVHPGIFMTHDPPPSKPLRRKNQVTYPSESILAMGHHEAAQVKENSSKVNSEDNLETILTNAQPQEEVNFVFNQKLPFSAGQTCHFLPVPDLADVRRDTVLKLLVGLLNSGSRGVVYMGVDEDGTVLGITAEAQMIVHFVQGLMNTVKFYLMPRLHVPQYGVRYTNVMTGSGQLLNNMWIVELHAVPQMQHYYNPVMDMNYYIRHGKETKSLSFTAFCNAIVKKCAEDMEKETRKLQERVTLLEKALEEAGVDISSVGPHVCPRCYFNDCPTQCYGKAAIAEKR